MAIDSKLRGCDLVRLKPRDVFAAGRLHERASITQRKTGQPVRFQITEPTRAVAGTLDHEFRDAWRRLPVAEPIP